MLPARGLAGLLVLLMVPHRERDGHAHRSSIPPRASPLLCNRGFRAERCVCRWRSKVASLPFPGCCYTKGLFAERTQRRRLWPRRASCFNTPSASFEVSGSVRFRLETREEDSRARRIQEYDAPMRKKPTASTANAGPAAKPTGKPSPMSRRSSRRSSPPSRAAPQNALMLLENARSAAAVSHQRRDGDGHPGRGKGHDPDLTRRVRREYFDLTHAERCQKP